MFLWFSRRQGFLAVPQVKAVLLIYSKWLDQSIYKCAAVLVGPIIELLGPLWATLGQNGAILCLHANWFTQTKE